MKDLFNKYKNLKNEKKKLVLLISFFVLTISLTFAYFAPLIGDGATTNLETVTGLTDNLYFESGNTLSITADQFNFAEGEGDITDTTTASAYLRANTGNETATQYYEVYLKIIKNEYEITMTDNYSDIKAPDLILNVYDPEGNEIIDVGGLLYYDFNENYSGYDITEAFGLIPIKQKYEIKSVSSDKYTIQDWKFVVTFLNQEWDQSANANKVFEAEIVMKHIEPLEPVMAIYSEDDTSLRFYNYDENAVVGESYNNLTVTKLYTGLEYTDFLYINGDYDNNILWDEYKYNISIISFEDRIKVRNTRNWFNGITMTSLLNLNNLDLSDAIVMSSMFSDSKINQKNIELDLSDWNVSSVTDMSRMFSYFCGNIEVDSITINLTGWDTSKVLDMSRMFSSSGEKVINDFKVLGLENWDVSNVEDMSGMFSWMGIESKNWNVGDLSNWDTINVRNMSGLFGTSGEKATNWNVGDLSSWNTSKVTDMSYMFDSAGESAEEWDIGTLSSWDTSNVTTMESMFYRAGYNATTWNIGNLSNWDTSNVTNMYEIFSGAGYSATTWNIGDLSSWNTLNVTNMFEMFSGAGYSATTWNIGDLSSWDVSNVKYMSSMFENAGCGATTWNIGDLSEWNTSNVEYMDDMFKNAGYNSESWNIGDISNWDTYNVTNMESMFENAGYSADYSLDLSTWKVPLVAYYDGFNTGVESKITPPVWVN